jgi:hypothetical protein
LRGRIRARHECSAAAVSVNWPVRLACMVASVLTLCAAPTPRDVPAAAWVPPQTAAWHWMIDHALDVDDPRDMGLTDPHGNWLTYAEPEIYDIDGFFNGQDPNCNIVDVEGTCVQGENDAIQALHARGKRVICYIDTGVYEDYRPDAYKFPASVIGRPNEGWEGSYWLDIRQTATLFPIMEARIKMCKDKGFDSVEPDEMVNYSNNSGFPLVYQDQLTYNRGIAEIAHRHGLSIGLKGNAAQAADLVNDFDWMLNEQCYEYDECYLLHPFMVSGKAVFEVEYNVPRGEFCADANARGFNAMQMPLALDGGRWPCR